MRLVVTGGGTGGHVYPALEVARHAQLDGAELLYLGSIRGQEAKAAAGQGILFQGFPSEPLYSLRTPRGLKAAAMLLKATLMARKYLAVARPDVVFSTGGYSAAPVMLAARMLKIPYCLHACDTVPGRALMMVAKEAAQFTCTFKNTSKHVSRPVVRTGHPIRQSLREGLAVTNPEAGSVLGLGGSQGSAYLNGVVPMAARGLNGRGVSLKILLSAGPNNIDSVRAAVSGLANVDPRAYLGPEELVAGYRSASLAIARSGGTIAEFALARLPSVLIPLPSSADNHQYHNAMEFVEMGGASLFEQSGDVASEADGARLAEQIEDWVTDKDRVDRAKAALSAWDTPNATATIYNLVKEAASS